MGRFDNKVVIVTGSSAGIGKAVIIGFAKEGANVVLHGTNTGRLDDAEKALHDEGIPDSRILRIQGSLIEDAVVEKIIDETVARFGKIDVLVNNAGNYLKSGKDVSIMENFDYVFALNLRAPFRLVELATPHLEKTKGNIINVSAIIGQGKQIEIDNFVSYAMSKAALDRFTLNANQGLAKKGIRLNTISPGPFESNFIGRAHEGNPEVLQQVQAGVGALVSKIIPAGRFGRPEELVPAFLLLADENSSFITGSIWVIDGGTSNWAPEATDLKI
uniref:NAD(P)-binding protein n=1 Tax=Panagrellus redivivus TaxID=6233 RepID=A0A7E4W9I7_PANRE